MKKRILVIIIIAIFLITMIVIFKNKSNIEDKNNEQQKEEYNIKDDSGSNYKVVYNERSFVYEIYDENDVLQYVSPNKDEVELHINSYTTDIPDINND